MMQNPFTACMQGTRALRYCERTVASAANLNGEEGSNLWYRDRISRETLGHHKHGVQQRMQSTSQRKVGSRRSMRRHGELQQALEDSLRRRSHYVRRQQGRLPTVSAPPAAFLLYACSTYRARC
jgi:hypothetical protein